MRKLFYVAFVIMGLSCSKEGGLGGNDEVEYVVTTTNSGQLNVIYMKSNGQQMGVAASKEWKMKIYVPQKPFTTYLEAVTIAPAFEQVTSCTVKILVNGKVRVSDTHSNKEWASTSVQYIVE